MSKLLFVTQYPFYPDISGGSELSTLYLLKSLCQMDWQVEVICTRKLPYTNELRRPYFWESCWQSLMRLSRRFGVLRDKVPVVMDEELGYPCWRVITPSRFPHECRQSEFFAQRLREYQPDVVVGQRSETYPLLKYSASQGYLALCFVRDLAGDESDDYTITADGVKLIVNSPFLASIVNLINDQAPEVILPFIDVESYRVSNHKRKYITFINPIPEKGLDIAIEVARQLPHEKFLFVKGKWGCYDQDTLLKQVYRLPNVEIWENQQDMRHVYAVTDILLVPSQFLETFGRVIIEAQVNSIPVVAANVGGIPYTLGKGGILIEPADQPQVYVDALLRLRNEDKFYEKLSELSFQNSQRPEFDAHYQVKKFVQFVKNNIQGKQLSIGE